MSSPLTNSLIQTSDLSRRLVPLSDGRPGLRGGIHVEIREPAAGKPVIEFAASDESLDRYDEIVMASGWKLESYRRNPVFQNAHKYGDVIFTLGKALLTEVREVADRKVLLQQVEFAVDVNPMAKIAYGLYKGKFLNAVSVGFVPVRWEDGTQTTSYRRKYLEQELLEVSAVGIPANPNALALGLKSGAIEKSDLKDTLDLLRLALDRASAAGAIPSPGGPRDAERTTLVGQLNGGGVGNALGQGEGGTVLSHSPAHSPSHPQLLSLSRTLRDLLRHI